MNIFKEPEHFLTETFTSIKNRKIAIFLVLAGIIICIIPLLPIVQNILFSFVDARTSGVNLRTSGSFDSRLFSLLTLPFFGLIVLLFALACLFSKTIASFLEDVKNDKLIIIFSSIIIAFLLCFTSIFSYRYGWQFLNSDHSAEMFLGKLLAQENKFVTSSWKYSTEIRLIYQTLFTMPLFKLLGHLEDWALIRSVNIFMNTVVLLLSYFFLAKQIKIQTKWICITSIFLLVPISTGYWDIVIFGGYYIFFIAQLFFCTGLFLKIINNAAAAKSFIVYFILFTILSFLLGLQGIRSVLCLHIPLLITSIFLFIRSSEKKKFPLFLGCYGFILCFIGFAFNFLLRFKFSFYSYDNMRLEKLFEMFFSKLGNSLISILNFFGFSIGASLLSAAGLLSLAAIIGTFILFKIVFKYFRQPQSDYQFLPVFFAVAVIFNSFVFIILEENVIERYFYPFLIFFIPLIAILFELTKKSYSHLKFTALFMGIVLFIFGQSYINFQNLSKFDVNSTRKGCIQYLTDNRLEYGFATFWNSYVTTELSNGKVELAGLEPYGLEPDSNARFNLQGWLNPVKFYDTSYHDGESFLLLTREEWELAQTAERPFSLLIPDYEDDNFIIIRHSSAQAIHQDFFDN